MNAPVLILTARDRELLQDFHIAVDAGPSHQQFTGGATEAAVRYAASLAFYRSAVFSLRADIDALERRAKDQLEGAEQCAASWKRKAFGFCTISVIAGMVAVVLFILLVCGPIQRGV